MTVTNHTQFAHEPQEQTKLNCCSSTPAFQHKSRSLDINQGSALEILNDSPQTTMYRIPAGHATYDNPLTPERQAEFEHSIPDYMQTVPAHAESGVLGMAAPSAESKNTADGIMTTTHLCHCGEGCECMACPVHPGNATTQARVKDLYDLIENEPPFSPNMDEMPPWPAMQEHVGAMTNALNPDFAHATPPAELALGCPSNYAPHQLEDHWVQTSTSPGFSASGSEPSLTGFPHTTMGVPLAPSVNLGPNHAAPSHEYLHFQFPVHYMG